MDEINWKELFMMCPSCKSTEYKEARQCPLYDGKAVCIDCCRKCAFYSKDNLYACGFYIKRRATSVDIELAKRRDVVLLKKQVEKFKHNLKIKEFLENKIEELKK